MSYEKVVHDQSLYCASQALELSLKLSKLSKQLPSDGRVRDAKQLVKDKSNNESRIAALRNMYRIVGRKDLEQLMFELSDLTIEEISTALSDPDGWQKALEIAGQIYKEVPYTPPKNGLEQWREKFTQALNDHTE